MRVTAALLGLLLSLPLAAQSPRDEMARARQAMAAGDHAAAAGHLRRVLEMEHDPLNRPYYQYLLARALAFQGAEDDAAAWLETIWKDGIEGPMASMAAGDPAFAAMRDEARFRELMAAMRATPATLVPLGRTIHAVEGGGAAILASLGADGVLLVDGGYPVRAEAIGKALREANPRPVRFVVNTHAHFDHIGANVLGRDAARLAHPTARRAMREPEEFVPGYRPEPLAQAAMPDVAVESPVTIHFNGETVRLIPLPAHTDGDLAVVFVEAAIVHMGDLYFPGGDTPVLWPGGDPRDFTSKLTDAIASLPDEGRVVSGHGAIVPLKELRAALNRTSAMLDLVEREAAAGKSDEEIAAALDAEGLPGRWSRVLRKGMARD